MHANSENYPSKQHEPTTIMTDTKQNIIQLDTLEVGEHRYHFLLDDNFFHAVEKSEVLGGNVNADVLLNLREQDFDLQISVNGTVQVTCDRCLDPMDLDVNASEDQWEWDEEPVHTLDLNWLAYELIVTNLPLVHSHQPGGCNPLMAALLQDHLCTNLADDNNDNDELN